MYLLKRHPIAKVPAAPAVAPMNDQKDVAAGYGFGEAIRQARLPLLRAVYERTPSGAFREKLKENELALRALPPLCDAAACPKWSTKH